ncbi:hypothetical protein CRG98_031327 [Punica granatum]|uniref:Uncharacterized protein n=1 Tax=Punica granatum TaxID=22663 RepID=A0A2I0IW83_PUNGR|nr:hypothetical protein CRG98_031327 [Punica granatum]
MGFKFCPKSSISINLRQNAPLSDCMARWLAHHYRRGTQLGLARLPFLAGPLRNLTLLSPLSRKFAHGTTLIVSLLRPLLFTWVLNFPSPEEVPVLATSSDGVKAHIGGGSKYDLLGTPGPNQGLRASSLSGTRGSDWGSVDYGGAARRSRNCCSKDAKVSVMTHLIRLSAVHAESRGSRAQDMSKYSQRFFLQLAENCKLLTFLLIYDGHLGACLLWLPGRFEAERLGTTRFLILRGMEWPRVQNSTSLGGKWGLWVTAGAH